MILCRSIAVGQCPVCAEMAAANVFLLITLACVILTCQGSPLSGKLYFITLIPSPVLCDLHLYPVTFTSTMYIIDILKDKPADLAESEDIDYQQFFPILGKRCGDTK